MLTHTRWRYGEAKSQKDALVKASIGPRLRLHIKLLNRADVERFKVIRDRLYMDQAIGGEVKSELCNCLLLQNVGGGYISQRRSSLGGDLYRTDVISVKAEEAVVYTDGGCVDVEHARPDVLSRSLRLCGWIPILTA